MEDDCYIPWHDRSVSALTKAASCTAEIVRNGKYRGEENLWQGEAGSCITYSFEADTKITQLRLVFDSDLNRNYRNMPCNYPLEEKLIKLPETLIKAYRIEGIQENGQKVFLEVNNSHQRFVKHTVDWQVKEIRFVPIATHGCETFRLFGFEIG